jgi:hypothetical protein
MPSSTVQVSNAGDKYKVRGRETAPGGLMTGQPADKDAAMKNPTQMTWKASAALLLGVCLFNANALAAEVPVPLKSMNQAEYEIYRQKLDLQVKDVAAGASAQTSAAAEKVPTPEAASESDSGATRSGYGKGYRARMERGGSTGGTGGYRGGSMSRGGGGRNR